MNNADILVEFFPDHDWLIADGFDDAIMGVSGDKVVYSVSKCIEIIAEDMSEEDAWEYFEYNVRGAYVGEQTPIFVDDYFLTS